MRLFAGEMLKAVGMTAILAVIVCAAYPVAVFAMAQGLFSDRANGSIVHHQGTAVGSELLGQQFTGAKYFHPRPSSAGNGYDAAASGGSNLGPTSKDLMDTVQERVRNYRAENNLPDTVPVPADAVTASASGLDPHISVRNALWQAPRAAKARGLDVSVIEEEVAKHTESRTLGIFGEPRVNVLMLNLALDKRGKNG